MSKSAMREEATTAKMTITSKVFKKMPDNFPAVMTATIMIADNRKAETPGSFQYVANEMLIANKMPTVIFPESVERKNLQHRYDQMEKQQGNRKET